MSFERYIIKLLIKHCLFLILKTFRSLSLNFFDLLFYFFIFFSFTISTLLLRCFSCCVVFSLSLPLSLSLSPSSSAPFRECVNVFSSTLVIVHQNQPTYSSSHSFYLSPFLPFPPFCKHQKKNWALFEPKCKEVISEQQQEHASFIFTLFFYTFSLSPSLLH